MKQFKSMVLSLKNILDKLIEESTKAVLKPTTEEELQLLEKFKAQR